MRPLALVLVAALAAVTTRTYAADPSDAAPTSKETCREAYEASQLHRRKNELVSARQMLRVCAAISCPDVVRSDCIEWFTEVERSIASVVVGAKTDAGDVYDVSVAIDGKTVATELDGRAIELDPGRHTFEFVHAGSTPITRTEIVREGEKNRPLTVSWATPKPVVPPSLEEKPVVPMHRPVPALTYVLGGFAVVGFAGFTAFGLMGNQQKSNLDSCTPFCASSDVDSARRSYLLADVSLGVGAGALAAATLVWLIRPERPISNASITPVRSGAVLGWSDAF
jgi:hypothetical protein